MSESPDVYLEEPDALSTLFTGLALSAEIFVDGEFCGTWVLDASGSRKMTFHLIDQGEAWLHRENQPPKRLEPGDLIIFPHDDSHVLSNSSIPPLIWILLMLYHNGPLICQSLVSSVDISNLKIR
ncbi:cupin domain-containing protein [Microbulbifer sp. ZKSA006]|uniref:cupin domain-containing protein n=1 Tax=Microbulbifer sp. ZKSA006 TaxID=3243390 RepID=UPI0040392BB3